MKRSSRQRLTQGTMYAILVAVVVFLLLAADFQAIQKNFLNAEAAQQSWPEILTVAAKNTVIYTFIAFAAGLVGGLILALMKLSTVAPYRWLATVYVEFFRGLPALVTIIAFAVSVPIAFNWRPPGGTIGAGLVGLSVVAAAYMAETIRAGIQAVPKGQTEAARSLGMSGFWTRVSVVLPQAFRIIIPPLTNELVVLIKDTSLLFVVGMQPWQRELTTFSRDGLVQFANSTPLLIAALFYLIITLPLTRLVAYLERRTQVAL
jgi:polar amino acid transport system permease protein